MSALPALNPADAALLNRYLLAREDLASLRTQPDAPDLLSLLAFLSQTQITPWLDHYHALMDHARREAALEALAAIIRAASDPIQQRLASTTLLHALAPARRATSTHATPRHHPARAQRIARSPIPAPQPAPDPAPEPRSHPGETQPRAEGDHTPTTTSPAHAPHAVTIEVQPHNHPRALQSPAAGAMATALAASADSPTADAAPSPSMSLEQAMSALGIDPRALELSDQIEDAALDGDLADMLEDAALDGDLGDDLQRAAEDGTLDEAIQEAILDGEHLTNPALAAAIERTLRAATDVAPAGPPRTTNPPGP